jgi:hypothetical protein
MYDGDVGDAVGHGWAVRTIAVPLLFVERSTHWRRARCPASRSATDAGTVRAGTGVVSTRPFPGRVGEWVGWSVVEVGAATTKRGPSAIAPTPSLPPDSEQRLDGGTWQQAVPPHLFAPGSSSRHDGRARYPQAAHPGAAKSSVKFGHCRASCRE